MQKGIGLRLEYPAAAPRRLIGDGVRVRQILLNYLSNGVKFTESGEVRVQVDYRSENPGGPQCCISVIDTGMGIACEDQERLFSKFVQADSSNLRRAGGTGLGLAICKQLAGLLGGSVGLQSVPGEGSVFWVRLPMPPAPVAKRPPEPAVPAAGEGSAKRWLVLLAEDNPVNQKLGKLLLRKLGCEVDVASDGREALRRWSERPYDVIFMDCQMPDLDGYETTAHIRASGDRGREIPIIATTAYSMLGDRERCLNAGMSDYVSKPLNAEDLRRVLERATAGVPKPVSTEPRA
jgi:CheY-like chemotaxis protein